MKLCLFTKADDFRLNFFLQCLKADGLPVDLIIVAPAKRGKVSVRSRIGNKVKSVLSVREKSLIDIEESCCPIEMVENHNSDAARELLLRHRIDLVCLSKSGILKNKIVDGPWMIINAHPGILPRYRGKGSCEWAVYEGGPLGVTVHRVDMGIDTGRILFREFTEPLPDETLCAFRRRLDEMGARAMVSTAKRLLDGEKLLGEIQDPRLGVLYTRKPLSDEMEHVEKRFKTRKGNTEK